MYYFTTTICSVLYHIASLKSKPVNTISCGKKDKKCKTAQNPVKEIVQFYEVKENESIKKKS
jgi:hypothetical protein